MTEPVDGWLPCPFCGSVEREVRENRLPRVQMSGKPGAPLSVEVSHRCERGEGILRQGFTVAGKTHAEVRAAWNKRV